MSEAKQAKFLQGLYLSFFSPSFYRLVAKHWRWRAFLFMLMVVAIIWFLMVIRLSINAHYIGNQIVSVFTKQLPEITLKNGVASTKAEGPFEIYYPGSKQVFAIIDTHGKYKNFLNSKALMLVTDKGVVLHVEKNKLSTYRFKKSWNKKLSAKYLVNLYEKSRHEIFAADMLIFYFVGYLFFLALCAIYFLIVNVILSIVAAGLDCKIPSRDNLALSVITMTPILIVFSLLYLFRWADAVSILVLLIIQFIYIILSAYFIADLYKKNKESKQ